MTVYIRSPSGPTRITVSKTITILLIAVLAGASGACRKPPAESTGTAGTSTPPATQKPAEPAKPMPAQLPDVLARVNGEDVSKTDFDLLVRNMELGNGPIPAERRDEVLRGALDRLITYTLLQQEAKSRNLSVTDAEIDSRVQTMRSQFPDENAFKKALDSRNMSLERLRNDTRADLLIGKMMEAEMAAATPATEAEVQAFYEKNPEKFQRGESVRASHILLLADQKADEATKKKARAQIDDVWKRAKAGEDFAALARQHSQDGSAASGGDLDFFTRGRMVPEFEQAAFALKPGEISDVVTTQYGFHVIKVTERKPASAIPLAEVSDRVRQFLTEQKKQERADAFIAGLKQKSRIEVLV
jgi:peptidyl-prolyl cis-trans isomerase C